MARRIKVPCVGRSVWMRRSSSFEVGANSELRKAAHCSTAVFRPGATKRQQCWRAGACSAVTSWAAPCCIDSPRSIHDAGLVQPSYFCFGCMERLLGMPTAGLPTSCPIRLKRNACMPGGRSLALPAESEWPAHQQSGWQLLRGRNLGHRSPCAMWQREHQRAATAQCPRPPQPLAAASRLAGWVDDGALARAPAPHTALFTPPDHSGHSQFAPSSPCAARRCPRLPLRRPARPSPSRHFVGAFPAAHQRPRPVRPLGSPPPSRAHLCSPSSTATTRYRGPT